jgi:hypothetical protein
MEPTLGQLALAEIKRREEEEAPLGGWGGEIAVQPAAPPPPPPKPFVIPPPPWSENYRPELDSDAVEPESEPGEGSEQP